MSRVRDGFIATVRICGWYVVVENPEGSALRIAEMFRAILTADPQMVSRFGILFQHVDLHQLSDATTALSDLQGDVNNNTNGEEQRCSYQCASVGNQDSTW